MRQLGRWLAAGVAGGIGCGVAYGLLVGLVLAVSPGDAGRVGDAHDTARLGWAYGALLGLPTGVAAGVVVGIVASLLVRSERGVAPRDRRAHLRVATGLAAGVVTAVVLGAVVLREGPLVGPAAADALLVVAAPSALAVAVTATVAPTVSRDRPGQEGLVRSGGE